MGRTFDFGKQIRVGDDGVRAVARYLHGMGYHIEDVTADKVWQKRDVDLIVGNTLLEVKTDTHTTGNIFLELEYLDGRPGCLFQSRAEMWAYWNVEEGTLLLLFLPRLQLWVTNNRHKFETKRVRSKRGTRKWGIVGIAVPQQVILDAKVGVLLEMEGMNARAA